MRFTVHLAELPVHLLNKLESLTLDIFSRDLTISPVVWDQWLGHMLSYHLFHASDAIDTYARASELDPSNHVPTAYTRLVASAVVRPPGLTGPPLLLQSASTRLPILRGTGLRVQYLRVCPCSSLNVPTFVSIIFVFLIFFSTVNVHSTGVITRSH